MQRIEQSVHSRGRRSGAALVELAVCLPVVVLIAFGSIEATNALFLQQALTEAAHEGARTATSIGKTEADARVRIGQILSAQSIKNATVSISPAVTSATPVGEVVTVRVAAPAESNIPGTLWFFGNRTIDASVVMLRQ